MISLRSPVRIGSVARALDLLGIADQPRQIDLHRRAGARLAVDLDMALRLLDEAIDLAEPEPGAFAGRFGGEKRIERARRHVGRHADAGIGDREHDILARLHFRILPAIGVVEIACWRSRS